MGLNQELINSRSITLTSPPRDSSTDSSSTLPLDQSAAWSGKVIMPSLPEERCSVPPSHSILSQVPSEETTASTSEETSVTDLTLLNLQTTKSISGSPKKSNSHGPTTPKPGFMSDLESSSSLDELHFSNNK